MKCLSEQEWVYEYFTSGKRNPLILGSKGTWGIGDQRVIILVAFTIPDIMVLKEIHKIAKGHPIRNVKYKGLLYYAVNIIDQRAVTKIIETWSNE